MLLLMIIISDAVTNLLCPVTVGVSARFSQGT